MLVLLCVFSSCNKTEDLVQQNSISSDKNISSSARKSAAIEFDSFLYYANLGSPSRDIDNFKMMGGVLPAVVPIKYDAKQQATMAAIGGGGNNGDCYSLPVCNGISFPLQPGWSCDVMPPKDTFNNVIKAFGQYGADNRQQYVVHYPANKNANSPIVVLVHGGGWFSGPNPDNLYGWPFGFTNDVSDNLVKNLLDSGYVVVSMLYRLVQYGNNNAEITANPTTWQNQIDDIDAAIQHIHSNFPTCLNLNANSMQLLGESAGGHLALMWAYTKANTSYVKSVITCYAPTNLQQYGSYLQSKTTGTYACGWPYFHFPFYFPVNTTNYFQTYSSISPLNCIPNAYDPSMSIWRIIDTYNMIQSAAAQVIATPYTNSTLATYSPKNALNNSRIIPTFIMHSDAGNDHLVPYNQSTNGMNTKLSMTGGLIATLTTNTASVSYNYATTSAKHLIKLFSWC